MIDERTDEIVWPKHELVLHHSLTLEQFRDLMGKMSSDWIEEQGKRLRITASWLGQSPLMKPSDYKAETMDLELFHVGWTLSVRNNEIMVIGRLLRRVDGVDQTLVGDGRLFIGGAGAFTVRGQLVSRAA